MLKTKREKINEAIGVAMDAFSACVLGWFMLSCVWLVAGHPLPQWNFFRVMLEWLVLYE